ncbi:MAG: hypothetical protein IKU61_01135, partial [Clostridia bacterium]|nr:hypothetical protein [Clostridia bacterium]
QLPCTDMVYCTSAIYRVSSDVPAVSGTRACQEIAARELAAEGEKCTYVDLYALTLEKALGGFLLSSDDLHPHVSGYTIMSDVLYDVIRNGNTEQKDFEMTDIYVSAKGRATGMGTKEDPTSNLSVAFGKAAEEATIHIIGEYKYDKISSVEYGFQTPMNVKKLTIVGEGEGAKLTVNCQYVFVNSDIVFDNIALESKSSGFTVLLGYHNATFTETFKSEDLTLVAGVCTYADDKASFWYSSKDSADFDNDCEININGGKFTSIIGGNITSSRSRDSAFGTYGGNMVINIGKGATVGSNSRSGAVGQNYITGSVTMNVGAWGNTSEIREFALIGSTNGAKEYDETRNTGSVKINILDGVSAKIAITGDINKDGKVSLIDALEMLKLALENKTVRNTENYYGITSYKVNNVENLIPLTVK